MLQQSIHRWLWAACLVVMVGCSGDSESEDNNQPDNAEETNPGDNTTPGDDTQTPDETTNPDTNAPAEPALPTEPSFHTWIPERCELGYRADIASTSCVQVGPACDPDTWAEAPQDAVGLRYVTPVGTGNGLTPQTPMGSIQNAIDSLSDGGTVILSSGTFEEPIIISGGVQIIGSCPRFTRIISTTASIELGTVEITGEGDNGIRNLTISGPRPGVWVWDLTGTAHVQDVIIDDAEFVAFAFSGDNNSTLVENVVISETKPSATDGYGWGMELFGTASLELRNVTFESNTDVSLYAAGDGIEIDAENLVIARTQADTTSLTGGWGIALFEGATITLNQAYLFENRGLAVVAQEEGTSLEAHDMVVANTQEDSSDQTWGQAFNIRLGAHASLSQTYMTGNREMSMAIMDPGTTATLTDVVITDTQHQLADEDAGWGIWVYDGPVVDMERVRLTDNLDVGLLTDLAGTIVNATDLIIEGTRENTSGIAGWGIGIQMGSVVNLTRARIQDNREVGIAIFGADTQLVAQDLWVDQTSGIVCVEDEENPCGQAYGDGIEILGGSYLEMDRFQITGSTRVGLLIFDPTGRDTQVPDIPGSEWVTSGSPEVKLSNGSITQNLIGVNIQAEAIDLDSDFTNVLNYDNLEINLTTDNMSVPGPADALESAMETP